jgi:outer membrane lipoprotein-sorting protein
MAALVLAFVSQGTLQAQNVDEILAKHFEVIGQEKLSKVQNMTAKGKLSMMGLELPFNQYYTRKGQMRMDMTVQGMDIVQVVDGESGWMINPMMGAEPQDMDPMMLSQLKTQSDIDGPLVNYKDKGYTLDLIGTEDYQGAEVYKLKITQKDGTEIFMFIDTEAYVPLKMEVNFDADGQIISSVTELGGYKMVDGILLAHEVRSSAMGQTTAIILDEVVFDTPVDETMFKKPGK